LAPSIGSVLYVDGNLGRAAAPEPVRRAVDELVPASEMLFDHLRTNEHAPCGERPAVTVEGYGVDEAERLALTALDVGALHAMGSPIR